jgi:hypothetical protein
VRREQFVPDVGPQPVRQLELVVEVAFDAAVVELASLSFRLLVQETLDRHGIE